MPINVLIVGGVLRGMLLTDVGGTGTGGVEVLSLH